MNIEGLITSMRGGDDNEVFMTMEFTQEQWSEISDYAKSCCEDYDEQIDFYYEYLNRKIEFNVTNFITEIHDKYFKEGNRITKFPFKATFNSFYCTFDISFKILEVV